MDHAFDIQGIQGNEQPKRRHTSDRPTQLLAHTGFHVLALEPGLDIARRLIGTTLGRRAVITNIAPANNRLITAHVPVRWQVMTVLMNDGLDHPMHQQVRIASNG